LEQEISQAVGPAPHGGAWWLFRLNAADTKSNSGGGYTTAPKVQDIEDALRNQSKVFDMGARFMTGVKLTPVWPIESNVLAGTWVSQNPGSDVAASDPSFSQRGMNPRTLAACTSISRQLLAQSSSDIEGWIRARTALAHALALDRACIHGSGASNEPLGILGTAGIGNVAIGAAGGAPTSDFVNALESAVGGANADSPTCGFLTNSVMRSRLRKIPSMANGSLPLWSEGNTMLSHRAEVSNQIRSDLVKGASNDCSAIVYGDWSQLVVCEFQGAIEIVVDEYSARRQNLVEIASWGMYDTLLLQPTAMAAILDARNI
jgi:HK97 family phage major capsid protein